MKMNFKGLLASAKDNFLTSSIIYIFGSMLTTGLSFITTPIFTRLMSPEDYGIVSVFSIWVSVFSILVGLQTFSTFANVKVKWPEDKFFPYMSSVLSFSCLCFFLISGVMFVFRDTFSAWMDMSPLLLAMLLVQSFGVFAHNFYNSYLIQSKKAIQYLIISVCYSVLNTGLSLLLVYIMKNERYLGRIAGNTVVAAAFGLVFLVYILVKGKKFFYPKAWKYCLPLCIPIVLHNLSGLALGQSDRVMLQKMSGDLETGIYSFAYMIASILSVLWNASNNAWVPWYYEHTKRGETEKINQVARKYIMLFSIGTCLIMLMSPEVMRIMGPREYWSAGRVISVVIYGIYFNYLYTFAVNYEFYRENTRWIAFGTTVTAVINIVLNYYMIRLWGGMGAAIATLISYFLLFLFHNLIVHRMGGYNIHRKLCLIGIGITSFGFLTIQLTYDFTFIRWGVILIVGILVLLKYRNEISSLLKKIKR